MALAVAIAAIIGLLLAGDSSALRPSDHGLVFQTLSPAGAHSSPEMRSFFNSENSSPMVSSSSSVALPKATHSGEDSSPSWPRIDGGGKDGDHVGKALTVASLVCGVGGAVLLVVSGVIYVMKYRKRKLKEARGGDNGENNDDENNKLQLVVRNP